MGTRFSEDALAIMVRLYGEGKSAGEIGKEVHASAATVLRALRAEGVEIRAVGRQAGANGDYKLGTMSVTEARERLAAGEKQSDIAIAAGVTRQAVSAALRRFRVTGAGQAA